MQVEKGRREAVEAKECDSFPVILRAPAVEKAMRIEEK
jgi:hypothetical protein